MSAMSWYMNTLHRVGGHKKETTDVRDGSGNGRIEMGKRTAQLELNQSLESRII